MRKSFLWHNEPFTCTKCKQENPALNSGERNHCRACLHSLHVDADTPGDRASECNGLMEPCKLIYKGSKGFMIVHKCVICGKEMASRLADDDNKSILNRLNP